MDFFLRIPYLGDQKARTEGQTVCRWVDAAGASGHAMRSCLSVTHLTLLIYAS